MARQLVPFMLGSGSPRRLEILQSLGVQPQIVRPEVDESPQPLELPTSYVERVTAEKLVAVLQAHPDFAGAVLVADTTVALEGRILGKPVDDEDALGMLRQLAGRSHQVITSYALCGAADGGERERLLRTVSTTVTMRTATEETLAAYVSTGECRDKAGAYAIQGRGAFLVQRIDGSYPAVVGLPICELVEDLCALRVLRSFP